MHFSKRHLNAGNPLANALVVIVGILTIAASLVLGVVAMLVLGSIVLVLAGIIGIRIWWFKRQLAKRAGTGQGKPASGTSGVIEGEFLVISTDEDNDRQRRE
jgi:hypothetical protein